MKKMTFLLAGIWLTAVLSGCFALREAEESTGQVTAPTIAAPTTAPEPTAEPIVEPTEETTYTEESTADDMAEGDMDTDDTTEGDMDTDDTAADDTTEGDTAEGDTAAEPEATEEATSTEETTATEETTTAVATTYTIDATQSEASFTINEVLRGSDTTVVGTTSNLGGQISLDLNDPSTAQIGEIIINARDIATDNNFRNRAIRNAILLTDDHEFITFTPKQLVGLPETATIGETYSFQIIGDLTITDETREETFEATVTAVSATQLEGTASTVVLYADYGLEIPFSQSVDAVEDNVTLTLEFTAVAPE